MFDWAIWVKRLIVIVAWLFLIAGLFSYYTESHFLGTHDVDVMVACTVVIFIIAQVFPSAFLNWKGDRQDHDAEGSNHGN